MSCSHKTYKDFTKPALTLVGTKTRFVWICSMCGVEDYWKDGWIYYGKMECVSCGAADIEKVYCTNCAPTKGE